MIPRDDATERQVQAAEPAASTWLSANAGSGKTRVLTDRVARLLLSGVEPQHILCLTYTKAAASEMQNRLFRRLGEWAMLEDTALAAALDRLGAAGSPDLGRARTLFARAIETPGGLKIQTIHSFCSALLRRFPLEAGVSPDFSEMEDRAAEILRARIVEDMASGPDAPLIDAVARFLTDQSLDGLTAAICRDREAFFDPLDRAGLLRFLNVDPGLTLDRIHADTVRPGDEGLLATLRSALAESGTNDRKAAAKLADLTGRATDLPILESVFLTGAKAREPFAAKIGAFPTADLRDGPLAGIMPAIDALMARVEAARPQRLALAAAEKTAALHAFAAAFLPEYARRKQLRGWLDFDDLILKARALLTDSAVAAWVLFRLDGGIDHILVDEAQDTSPQQWDVIERLAQEFTAGQGARDVNRTIFVVGDKKQSIYSFQGADPQAFDRMREEFSVRLRGAGDSLQDLRLEHSFRSSRAILDLVDEVLKGFDDAERDGLHKAFKSDLPGRVDLWPHVPKTADPDDRPWYDPLDVKSPRHHAVILAERIADQIRRMIETDTLPDGTGQARRPVRPGDIMILVRRRSDLFAEIIRACKASGLPVAGADRLKVGAELAVRDLGALLSVLATPEDDLSLAAALKSPLFGWSEQDLYTLAHGRPGYLWEALRHREDTHPDTLKMLSDLMASTDFLRPYDLIERILTRHDGRRRLLARLGAEAEDGINALLSQALAYERDGVPSLTGFLSWMQTDDLDIKRETGSAANLIRVMTVHGSKGLESPIVILPDTARLRPPSDPDILTVAGKPMWKLRAEDMPPVMAAARRAQVNRQQAERNRLLYVAMTRAETWLIVAAAGDLDKAGTTWFQTVEAAMRRRGAAETDFDGETGLRLSHGDWTGAPCTAGPAAAATPADLPDHFRNPPPDRDRPAEVLTPAGLGGAKALPGEDGLDEAAALARGTAIHRLLEHLAGAAPADRPDIARRLLPGLDGETVADCLTEASANLDRPELAQIFGPESLAEVAITGTVAGRRLHGVIDRLIVGPDRVLAVDFKTNASVPLHAGETPEGLLRQLGAYAALLEPLYPGRPVETAILWTRAARLMPLSHEIVSAALARAPLLDDTGPRS